MLENLHNPKQMACFDPGASHRVSARFVCDAALATLRTHLYMLENWSVGGRSEPG